MNFQQLKIVREAVRQNFNLTEVGRKLFTSQSGVSKSLNELENELGIEIFVRSKSRLVGLSSEGEAVVDLINKILTDANNLLTLSSQLSNKAKGNLVLATTHAQARYTLPNYINKFALDYPDVHLTLHQSSPEEICDLLLCGEADIGIASEGVHLHEQLITIPWYEWYHVVIAQQDHPVFNLDEITLENLAQFPIITYHAGLTGRSRVDKAFEEKGLYPDIVLTALDADVIKTYVESGLGIGIIASIAFDTEKDKNLQLVSAEHLFERNFAKIAFRKNHYLRGYAYDFVERLSPGHNREKLKELINT
ncbi:MAG: CysB family HTH-type transcriptional regulator [Methylotenera sp.]|nr:CysB family HTH-type transcriptional regulator [Methylotenera sp.]